jgi:hypothetical protein
MLVHQRTAYDVPIIVQQHQEPIAYEESQYTDEAEVLEQRAEGKRYEHEHPYQIAEAHATHQQIGAQYSILAYREQHEGFNLLHWELGHGKAHEKVGHKQIYHTLIKYVVGFHAGEYLSEHGNEQYTEHYKVYKPKCYGKAHEVLGEAVLVVHRMPFVGNLAQRAQFTEEGE